jgi:hypothetical protein
VAAGAISILVAFQGMAITPVEQTQVQDPVQLKNWSAAPFWAPEASGAAVSNGTSIDAATPPAPSTTVMPYVAISPCRLVDTRVGYSLDTPSTIPWGPPSLVANPDGGPVSADRTFSATAATAGVPCPAIPAGARAIAASVTAWKFTANGKILVYSADELVHPITTTVNFRVLSAPIPSATLAQNYAIIPLDANGQFKAQANQNTDIIIDVNGYYIPTGIVNSLNSLTGNVVLSAGTNISLTPSGNTITIASSVPSGPSGPSGPEGPTGATGPSGTSGPSGPQGLSGPSGPQGLSGPSGPQGLSGPSGPQGLSGPSGPQGLSGPSGPQGLSGPSGPQGLSGPSGPQGIQGIQGLSGPSGPSGATGAAGPVNAYSASSALPGTSVNATEAVVFEKKVTVAGNFVVQGTVQLDGVTLNSTTNAYGFACYLFHSATAGGAGTKVGLDGRLDWHSSPGSMPTGGSIAGTLPLLGTVSGFPANDYISIRCKSENNVVTGTPDAATIVLIPVGTLTGL